MIRWYDYILAILAADYMLGFILRVVFSTTWWEPILYGLLAGLIWDFWADGYCKWRLGQELRRGK